MINPTSALDFRVAITEIERAVLSRLSLALQARRAPVASRGALRLAEMTYVRDGDLVFVEDVGRVFRWHDLCDLPDDDAQVVQPRDWLDLSGKVKTGRWQQEVDLTLYAPRGYDQALPLCAIPRGYVRTVQLYQGQGAVREILERIFGGRPCLLPQFDRARFKQISTAPAFYRVELDLTVLAVSFNPRTGPDAILGSELPAEAADDPGLNQLLMDAADALVGKSDPPTGYVHLVEGVDQVLLQDLEIEEEDLGQKLFVGSIQLLVVAYVHRPDRDTAPLTHVALETQLVSDHGVPIQEGQEGVLSGLGIPWPHPGLAVQPEAGEALLGGRRVRCDPGMVRLAADADVYRDLLPEGRLQFQAVAIDGEPPPLAPGALRIGVTTTDSGSVVFDRFLCVTLISVARDEVELR